MSLDSLNGMEYIGSHLKVSGFKEKSDGHIYYQIQASFNLKEPLQKQDFSYTYMRCLQLSDQLILQCPDIAQLPALSLLGFKPNSNEIERRRIQIEKWLSAIVWRCDVIGCAEFQEFCNLKTFMKESWLEVPKPSLTLNAGHLFPVVDFIYEPDMQVCFILMSDDSLSSKITSFVNVFMNNTKRQAGPPRSQVACYRLGVDDDGEPRSLQLWQNNYSTKATAIQWDEQLTILILGYENGTILALRVSSERNYKEYSEFCTVSKHTDAVTGIVVNSQTGCVYTISKDRCLITTDLSNPNNILKEKEFPYELTVMLNQKDQKRLFIADCTGSIYIFHYESGQLIAAHQITHSLKMRITSLIYCQKRNFLITGSKEGIVIVYEIGKVGKEKLTGLVSEIRTVINQSSLLFSLSTKELYVNYNNNVVILDSTKVKSLYSLAAHTDTVTKLGLYEDLGLLITSSKDTSVKFWQYKYFPHTLIETEIIPYRLTEQQFQQKIQKEESKSNINSKNTANDLDSQEGIRQQQQKPVLEDLDDWQ